MACLLVVLAQALLLAALVRAPGTGTPHRVPVTISAPGVVAATLSEQANGLPGAPFTVGPETSAPRARSQVRSGRSVAALLVDLRGTRDVLVLNPHRDNRLNRAVSARVRAIESRYHRTVDVSYSASRTSTGPSHAVSLTLVASVAGFLLVLVISLLRGPAATNLRLGVRRVGVLVVVSTLGGLVLALLPVTSLPGRFATIAGLGALGMLVVALTTLALEALAGLPGLSVAAALFFVLSTPLLSRTDAYLLPEPWPHLAAWTPTGAGLDAVDAVAFFDPARALRPILVLVGWVLVALAVLVVARAVRSRFGVDLTARPVDPRRVSRWRLGVLAAVAPLAALLGLAVVLVPDPSTLVAALPSRASETTCLGTGKIADVADLNRVAGRLRGDASFQGGDVGADVRLQDGRRLWVFGDTLRGADFDGQRFVRNSMLVIAPGCLQVVLPADHGALIPDRQQRAGESGRQPVGYWPMSIGRVGRPGYDLVTVATQRVRITGSGAFAFENLGTSIAVLVVPRGGTPQLIAQHDIGPDDPAKGRTTWGAASAVIDGRDGPWVYLYGTATPGRTGVFGYSLEVARVRPDDITDAARWRYWNGRSWDTAPQRAAVLIPAAGGVSQTLSVFEQGGTWYALSKQDEFLGTNLTVWTAPSPTGPFTARPALAQLPSDTVTGLLRYMPLAHPDLLPQKGTMVVSYSRNSTDFNAILGNPLLYRPRFLRVTLP